MNTNTEETSPNASEITDVQVDISPSTEKEGEQGDKPLARLVLKICDSDWTFEPLVNNVDQSSSPRQSTSKSYLESS